MVGLVDVEWKESKSIGWVKEYVSLYDVFALYKSVHEKHFRYHFSVWIKM